MHISMASPTISPSSKHWWISQQDLDIMMIYMDYHETSLPPHLMIHTAFTLLHLISLITPSLSSHSTSCLLHQPQAIPQSSILTPRAYPSHKQHPHVPCLGWIRLYVMGTSLACHQTSCTTHKQSLTFRCWCF